MWLGASLGSSASGSSATSDFFLNVSNFRQQSLCPASYTARGLRREGVQMTIVSYANLIYKVARIPRMTCLTCGDIMPLILIDPVPIAPSFDTCNRRGMAMQQSIAAVSLIIGAIETSHSMTPVHSKIRIGSDLRGFECSPVNAEAAISP